MHEQDLLKHFFGVLLHMYLPLVIQLFYVTIFLFSSYGFSNFLVDIVAILLGVAALSSFNLFFLCLEVVAVRCGGQFGVRKETGAPVWWARWRDGVG